MPTNLVTRLAKVIAPVIKSVEDVYRENQKLKALVKIKHDYRKREPGAKRDRAALRRIAEIIYTELTLVDTQRPNLDKFSDSVTADAVAAIYALALGKPETWRPK